MHYAVIDIETTGGKSTMDRITEIAIIKHDGVKEIDRYHSLVNPERGIPPFITSLTGIDNEMVSTAPKFFEIAKEIVEFTEDCYFVAHNVNFDYGFIQQEFKSLGFNYNRKRFCTVKLSRKLLPGLKSYSLGKLCKSLDIELANHHRALDDAFATSLILELLATKPGFKEYVVSPREKLLAQTNLDESLLDKVNEFPEAIGVYYFLNKAKEIIYVGKSKNIKKRIFTHLYNTKTAKAIAMKEEVADFDFSVTDSELVALLNENQEIKKIQPKYNRALKRKDFTYGLLPIENQKGFKKVEVVKLVKGIIPIMAFANKTAATECLFGLERKFKLCSRINSSTGTSSLCLSCEGACKGDETVEDYNLKVDEAMNQLGFGKQSFIIREQVSNGSYYIIIKNGHYGGVHFRDRSAQDLDFHELIDNASEILDKHAFYIINHFMNTRNDRRKVFYLD